MNIFTPLIFNLYLFAYSTNASREVIMKACFTKDYLLYLW